MLILAKYGSESGMLKARKEGKRGSLKFDPLAPMFDVGVAGTKADDPSLYYKHELYISGVI
jgi:hypothetical protein